MKKLPLLLLSLFTLSLMGCGHEEEQQILQADFDQYNPKGNDAICIETKGNPKDRMNLNGPYETYEVTAGVDDYKYLSDVNDWRNSRLAIFAEIGLLNQEKLPNGQYRYTPTDEGRHYISERNNDRFCFGRVVVTDIKYEKKQDGLSLFTYRYYLENVPYWARDERLYEIDRNIRNIANATLENGESKWWGGMVWFTSDKQIDTGSTPMRIIF